jgi:hypothetical protein
MKNVSDQNCRENQNKIFVSIIFYERCAVYEIMWKNILEPDVTDNMAHAHCMLDT